MSDNTPPKVNIGCGCLPPTIVIIIIWMACTGRLSALIDKLIATL